MKHLSSLQRWAISNDESRTELDAGLLTEVADGAGVAATVLAAGSVALITSLREDSCWSATFMCSKSSRLMMKS
jgi:hypothetical protein